MKKAIVLALVLSGCGFKYKPTDSSNVLEDALISETARAAGVLNVRVHGEITNTISKGQQIAGQPDPTGWYQAGVAWYYRPRIEPTVSIDPAPGKETARNVAGHEVCHAISYFHDMAHWKCMTNVAAPTYPRPGTSGVSTFSCNAQASSATDN